MRCRRRRRQNPGGTALVSPTGRGLKRGSDSAVELNHGVCQSSRRAPPTATAPAPAPAPAPTAGQARHHPLASLVGSDFNQKSV